MVPSKNIYNIKRHVNNNHVGYTYHTSKMINNVAYNIIITGYATHQITNRTFATSHILEPYCIMNIVSNCHLITIVKQFYIIKDSALVVQ